MTSTPSSRAPSRPDVLALLASRRPRPLVMGIVNVTPDSFYAGGRRPDPAEAVERGLEMAAEGADILDVGGQSTRPGSDPVPAGEELKRTIPVVEALAGRLAVPVSIDTDKAQVAAEALGAGAAIVNDVSALRNDPGMTACALRAQAVILMHRGGESPKTMQDAPSYGDAAREVSGFLRERARGFIDAGGDPRRVLIDPGIGFGKTLEHNLDLLRRLDLLVETGFPVVLGASRKSFLGRIMAGALGPVPGPEERLEGSLAVAAWAALKGVKVVRVHDVLQTRRALDVLASVAGG